MNIRYPIYEGVYRILTKQVGNTILAKGVNHILAKRDNSAWPKGAKLSGFSNDRLFLAQQEVTLDDVPLSDTGR